MDIKEMKIDISNENVCNYCLIHLKCLHYLIVYRSNIRNMLIVYGFKSLNIQKMLVLIQSLESSKTFSLPLQLCMVVKSNISKPEIE